ncbi:FAD-dependent oxidoreductase [Cognatilysobacter bugurensis]|uniref:2-octaprenyl-3-methyl-6-methoxy-1,4-benzoquinol hydroxylase n=1 Tax=Cognatilysobacter bugurensis TaxID=543356 RepID=A0A918T600_9GAMM|nr:FAD-dependent oxidoreductase [Lysobacter bugurensis]GHA89809.1 2-octaprenyl-3-methyl-6-methoxy-1,4-benzoquinol hydroxylase [Lysobacter bugurensis]
MSRRESLDAVVVGAGVVGAAAALGLARDGAQVALVEAQPPAPWRADAPDLRVYAFAPDNAAQLESLGAWASIRDTRAQPYRAMRVWDAAGGRELAFDADAFARRELGWIVEHALLVDRLWHALPAAGVDVQCPERVIGLTQDEQGAALELESGRTLRARLVVAADGAGSGLRELAAIEAQTHDYSQHGLVAYVDTELPHEATCWQRFLPTGPLALLPFADVPDAPRGHRGSIVWTLPSDEATRVHGLDEKAFAREFEHAFAGRLGAATLASDRAVFALKRQLASPRAGRVVLVGDAAHVVHPLAGQGVNLGLRDVARLRRLVGVDALRDGVALDARLRRWARECRSENALSAHAFDAINRLFSNDAPVPTLMRGPLLGLAGRLPPLTHALWRHAAGL